MDAVFYISKSKLLEHLVVYAFSKFHNIENLKYIDLRFKQA